MPHNVRRIAVVKKQTRRSVSMRPDVYDRLNAYCTTHKLSKSSVVEELVAASFEKRAPNLVAPQPKKSDGVDLPPPRGSGVNFL
jgi:hypothetical protein